MIISASQFWALFRGQPIDGYPHSAFTSGYDLGILLALVNSFRPARMLEIGVGTGAIARMFFNECPWIQQYTGIDIPPTSLPTFDFQRAEVPRKAGEFVVDDPRFSLILSEHGSLDLEAGTIGEYDFAYIDGDHSPDAVHHDTVLARAAVPHGVIVWHDYGRPKAYGPRVVIDDLNAHEGDHICLVDGTTVCFEIRY